MCIEKWSQLALSDGGFDIRCEMEELDSKKLSLISSSEVNQLGNMKKIHLDLNSQ